MLQVPCRVVNMAIAYIPCIRNQSQIMEVRPRFQHYQLLSDAHSLNNCLAHFSIVVLL